MSIGAEQRYYMKLKAVYYYYEKDYTQTEIAQMLNVSRITLSKLLKEAREEGMVKIEIVDYRNVRQLLELEAQLKDRFGLLDVKVVDCLEDDREEISRKLAVAGARYLDHILRSGMRVGIAWGRTLEMMVDHLSENRTITGIEVDTLLGGAGTAGTNIQPNIIAQRLIEKYSGTGYIINAPYLCQTEELCQAIKAEPHIADVISRAQEADITLVGIGEKPELASGYDSGYRYTDEVLEDLLAHHAVGDICANFFDIHGKLCDSSVCRRVVSIDISQLHKHKRVIAVAGGPNKVEAVLGALNGGYLHVLVTDKFTARQVLELDRQLREGEHP